MDWNLIINYGLKILGYAAGTVVITLASILFAKLKAKIAESKLSGFIEKCVRAAEQLYPNLGKKMGKEKYQYVLEQVKAKYPKLVENEYLKTLIEAAVFNISEEVQLIAKEQNITKSATINDLKIG